MIFESKEKIKVVQFLYKLVRDKDLSIVLLQENNQRRPGAMTRSYSDHAWRVLFILHHGNLPVIIIFLFIKEGGHSCLHLKSVPIVTYITAARKAYSFTSLSPQFSKTKKKKTT